VKDSITVSIPSHPKYLSVIRAITDRIGQIHEMDEKVIGDIRLAVDEACSNVIKHAYKGDVSRKIIIKYTIKPDKFQVVIEDNGLTARRKALKGRDLDDIRPGGLGIHFIKRVFDVFELDEKKKKGNRLILVKYFK
jgi:anti-sigma regulatory factor (Ser/Thr protein kinase)